MEKYYWTKEPSHGWIGGPYISKEDAAAKAMLHEQTYNGDDIYVGLLTPWKPKFQNDDVWGFLLEHISENCIDIPYDYDGMDEKEFDKIDDDVMRSMCESMDSMVNNVFAKKEVDVFFGNIETIWKYDWNSKTLVDHQYDKNCYPYKR